MKKSLIFLLFLSAFGLRSQVLENSAWNIGPDSIYFQTDTFIQTQLGNVKVTGQYVDTGGVLVLQDFVGPHSCDTNIIGRYAMTFNVIKSAVDSLSLTLIEDTCTVRSIALDGSLLTKINPYVGLAELKNAKVLVYPNPSASHINIELRETGDVFLELLEMNGRRVDDWEFTKVSKIRISHAVNPGIYFLKIQTAHVSLIQKLIIE